MSSTEQPRDGENVLSATFWAIGDPGRAGTEVVSAGVSGPPGWPDTSLDSTSLPGLDIRAASVRGLQHRYENTPRQDAHSVATVVDPDALIVTVCDGVGSLPQSHAAAQLLVSQMPEFVQTHRDRAGAVDWPAVFATASNALRDIDASARAATGAESAVLATTVVCAVIRTDLPDELSVDVGWVGDSLAYVLRQGTWGLVKPAADPSRAGPEPAPDEFATTRVSALPADRPASEAGMLQLGHGDALFLMTDGVAKPLGLGRGIVGNRLGQWWHQPPDIFDFAGQVAFRRRTFVDDRTVVGVWVNRARRAETAGLPVPSDEQGQ